ncbi:MAG: 3-dehydroquinate synthase [Treponema sp.]|nr:3-dehydroquinate synthase [Treponema sp.]
METIHVNVKDAYDVLVGPGLLAQAGKLIAGVDSKIQKLMIVSDSHVAPLYMSELKESLAAFGFEVFEFVFEAGEQSKTLQTVGDILGALAVAAFTRTDAVVALGGGVATDMAGFAASIFLRGIKVFQIPTSLLAQVDASVGGKTGVDLPEGKNLVGAFWQPSLVIADTKLLASLDDVLFTEGMAEVIKYAFIWDQAFYKLLLNRVIKNSPELEEVVARCIQIKAEVVSQDEHDNGLRQLLNFGHTIGHVIEARSNFTVSHGFAVAKGMERISRTSPVHDELVQMLKLYELPCDDPISADQIMAGIMNDKKKRGSSITAVIVNKIGKGELKPMPVEEFRNYL